MTRSRIFILAFCLFGLVVGARWALYIHYGTDLPEWDQWDAEGMVLFYPWSLGRLHLSCFFEPQAEHHIVLTHFLSFGIVWGNGQWDQRLEAMVNAAMAGTIALSLWLLAARRIGRRWQIGLFLLLAALYALPVAWENILCGFDSAQFFLTGFAVGTIALLPFAEPYRAAWWGGAACALLSLGSLATGFFAAGIVGTMIGFQLWQGDRRWRSAAPSLAICGLAVATGVLTRTVVPSYEGLKAHSVRDFYLATVKALGWPAFDFNWGELSLILFLPWLLVTVRILFRRNRDRPPNRWNELLSGLGFWVILNVLAAAYARGADGPSPASRYVDTLVIGAMVNLLCLNSLWQRPDLSRPRRDLLAIFVGAWAFLLALGLAGEVRSIFTRELAPLPAYRFHCEQNVRNYLITRDETYLMHDEIPYPLEWVMKRDLDYKGLADRLPVSVRAPLAVTAAANNSSSAAGFQRCDTRRSWAANNSPVTGAGQSPATPLLPNAVTWGSYAANGSPGPRRWRSQPVRTSVGGWLKFELAGNLGSPGMALELRDAATDRVLTTVRSDRIPGDTWQAAYVRAPRAAFVIAAQDNSGTGWFAFSEPVEMSTGSYWAWRAASRGGLIAGLSGLLALGVLLVPRRRS